jgi:hypothetical protein
MNSDLLTRWTAIITNIAVVIGLGFVGLEFRNNARSIEAERIDSFVQGVSDIIATTAENEDLAEILYQAYADPDSLTGVRLDRAQNVMMLQHNNFRRVYIQHQAVLLPDNMYEYERTAVGFSFSSEIGLNLVALFQASTVGGQVWDIIGESAKQAKAYCIDPQNTCVARFESARGDRS